MENKGLKLLSFGLYIYGLVACCFLFAFSHVAGFPPELFKRIILFSIPLCSGLLLILNRKRILYRKFIPFIAAYLILCIIQTYNTAPSVFFSHVLDPFLAVVCMVMLCIVPLKKEDTYRKSAIRIAEISLIAMVVIVDFLSLNDIFAGVNSGITVNENYLGNINSCAAVIAANCFFINRNRIPKIAYGIAFFEALLFVILSTSRASLLAIAAYLFTVFCLNLKRNYARNKELVLSVTLIMVIVILASLKIVAEFIITNDLRLSSFLIKLLTGRYTIWFKVFPQYIKDSWLFGNGVSTMSYVNSTKLLYARSLVGGVRNDIFHNFILDIIYHGGIIGVIILSVGCFYLISFMKKHVDLKKKSTRLYLAALVSFLFAYLFDMLFIWDYSIAFFLMLCSIIINRKERYGKA